MDKEVVGLVIMIASALLVLAPELLGWSAPWTLSVGLLTAVLGLALMRQGRLENEEDDRDRR